MCYTPIQQNQVENGLQSRAGCHGWLSWMTFMDDFHGMTVTDDFHGRLDFAVYKLILHIDQSWGDRLMDRQTDGQTDIGTP